MASSNGDDWNDSSQGQGGGDLNPPSGPRYPGGGTARRPSGTGSDRVHWRGGDRGGDGSGSRRRGQSSGRRGGRGPSRGQSREPSRGSSGNNNNRTQNPAESSTTRPQNTHKQPTHQPYPRTNLPIRGAASNPGALRTYVFRPNFASASNQSNTARSFFTMRVPEGFSTTGSRPFNPGTTSFNPAPSDFTTTGVVRLVGLTRTDEQQSLSDEDLMYEYGFRTEHGTRDETAEGHQVEPNKRHIVTNYIDIKALPSEIHVYALKFLADTVQDGNDTIEMLLKNKTEKEAIFARLRTLPAYAALNGCASYVTDYKLIWSIEPLFGNDAQTTPQPAQSLAANHPITNRPIQTQSVSIRFDRTIAPGQDVRTLLHSTNASTGESDDPEILARGVNAFMTEYARSNMQTHQYATTSANKFFLTQRQHEAHLDFQQHTKTLRAFRAFSISMRTGADRLLLNIHVGASPFLENVKVDALVRNFKDLRKTPSEVFQAMKNKEVILNAGTASERRAIILEVGIRTMHDARTWIDLEQACSNSYYRRDFRDLPINIGGRHPDAAPVDRQPAQNLTINGFQSFRGVMASEQTTAMLKFACKLPIINKQFLEGDGFELFGISTPEGRQLASRFGMSVGQELLRIPARWLKAPNPLYRSGFGGFKAQSVEEASWNLKSNRFLNTPPLQDLVILDLHELHQWTDANGEDTGPDLEYLEGAVFHSFRKVGLTMSNVELRCPTLDQALDGDDVSEGLLRQFFDIFSDKPEAPMLVVMPCQSYDLYSTIKRVADLQLGRHVVCALSEKLNGFGNPENDPSGSEQHLANIAMKFNLKSAGTNHAVQDDHLSSVLSRINDDGNRVCDTIVLGADVAHPTASARPGCPSIAAVVGSTDDSLLHYPGSMRLQVSRQETIDELADMVKERLIDWAENHGGVLPSNMLFYRDGVSESQYKSVRQDEIPQLRTAYNAAYEYLHREGTAASQHQEFKLTFVIVGKRHNTRFFTDNQCTENTFASTMKVRDYAEKQKMEKEENHDFMAKYVKTQTGAGTYERWNHNIKPGFVVDQIITHPYSNDFYLQSHKPLQGTGRSAHYFVLTNQMRLSADDLQKVTHALCYIYARATKGVSYCAPAYYADRLCGRGRAWLRDWLIGRDHLDQNHQGNETFIEFKERVLEHVDQSEYWRPQRPDDSQGSPPDPNKYGQPRKNPWHPNLDNIMFYL